MGEQWNCLTNPASSSLALGQEVHMWWLCGVVVVSWLGGLRSPHFKPLRQPLLLVFHLPPTSPPSCDWVGTLAFAGVQIQSLFSCNSNGPGVAVRKGLFSSDWLVHRHPGSARCHMTRGCMCAYVRDAEHNFMLTVLLQANSPGNTGISSLTSFSTFRWNLSSAIMVYLS